MSSAGGIKARLLSGALLLLLTLVSAGASGQDTNETPEMDESETDGPETGPENAESNDSPRPKTPKAKANAAKKLNKETAAAVETLVREHIAHANAGDLDAYVNDFLPSHPQENVIRDYADRVLSDHKPKAELLALTVVVASKKRGRVVAIQKTSYQNGEEAVTDFAAITFHCRHTSAGWRLESTSRERLTEAEAKEKEAEAKERAAAAEEKK